MRPSFEIARRTYTIPCTRPATRGRKPSASDAPDGDR